MLFRLAAFAKPGHDVEGVASEHDNPVPIRLPLGLVSLLAGLAPGFRLDRDGAFWRIVTYRKSRFSAMRMKKAIAAQLRAAMACRMIPIVGLSPRSSHRLRRA
jgi:hypothetical protein